MGWGRLCAGEAGPSLPLFDLIQRLGDVSEAEMRRVFNMGLGMLVVLPAFQVAAAQAVVGESYVVGEIVTSATKGVVVVDG